MEVESQAGNGLKYLKFISFTLFVNLAFSRWGSYIGLGPLFISDVLIGLYFFSQFLGLNNNGSVLRTRVPLQLYLLPTYALARAAFSFAGLSAYSLLDLLRDLVPFIYCFIAVQSFRQSIHTPAYLAEKQVPLLVRALEIHTLWAPISALANLRGFSFLTSVFQAPILEVRPDIDSAINAVAIMIFIRRLMLGDRRSYYAILSLVGLTMYFGVQTRAGLISLVLAAMILYRSAKSSRLLDWYLRKDGINRASFCHRRFNFHYLFNCNVAEVDISERRPLPRDTHFRGFSGGFLGWGCVGGAVWGNCILVVLWIDLRRSQQATLAETKAGGKSCGRGHGD